MAETTTNSTLKRLQSQYRLVIINDDTFEEVIKFRLSRISVYLVFSTVFLLMIGLTIALLVFTPLKYYIPGSSGKSNARRELQALKIRTDSLEQELKYKNAYLDGIKKALDTNTVIKDTTNLKVTKPDISHD